MDVNQAEIELPKFKLEGMTTNCLAYDCSMIQTDLIILSNWVISKIKCQYIQFFIIFVMYNQGNSPITTFYLNKL